MYPFNLTSRTNQIKSREFVKRDQSIRVIIMNSVNLSEKFALFNEYWAPHIVGQLNGQLLKLAKFKGEFIWHRHEQEDELFLVVKGEISIAFRDKTVTVKAGEFYIVPKGVEHKPSAQHEAHVLLLEPVTTQQTGGMDHTMLVKEQPWI